MPYQLTTTELLREAIAGTDLSLHRIERKAGIAHSTLGACVTGERRLRSDNLIAVANACGFLLVLVRNDK
jgi:hypothetical protein